MALSIVILAAGQGKRMCSTLPKVLHKLAGKPLLEHVTETAQTLAPTQPPIVIYGHQGDLLQKQLAHLNVNWVLQTEQLGTGHALQQALPHFAATDRVLILYGDVPLISPATLKHFLQETPDAAIGLITTHLAHPYGFGRIVRDAKNHITEIVEEKDASAEQRAITEINSGIYLIPGSLLNSFLPRLTNQNAQKEFYLTDIIKMALAENILVCTTFPAQQEEILGVNDRLQLAQLERFYQLKQAEKLLLQGVTLHDPSRFDLRGELIVGQDVVIDINVIIEGRVIIGNHCIIGPNTILSNTIIGDHVEIKANSVIDGAEISAQCVIGPFARIRPGTLLAAKSHIGNFVEIKNSNIGEGSKVNHLTYIGDAEIGKTVNVGAGVITCNYDGVNKHRTHIGDNAFIGSNSSLIAPITIGDGATIGAGSVLTRSAPSNQLTVCRAQQRSVENWQRPKKKET